MSKSMLSESGVEYYLGTLCEKSDDGFQFAYSCALTREKALEVVFEAYQAFSAELPTPGEGDSELVGILKKIWQIIQTKDEFKADKSENKVFSLLFASLSLNERAVLSLTDFFGFQPEVVEQVLSLPISEIEALLSKSRHSLVNSKF